MTDQAPARQAAFGIAFDRLDLDAATAACAARPAGAAFEYVVTPHAVHVVRTAEGDPAYLEGINAAWMVICDSRVVRNFARLLLGVTLPVAPGSDLTVRLLRDVIAPDDPVCVIGGDAVLAEKLRAQGLRRLAMHVPPMGFVRDPAEVARCIDFVRAHPSRFVFLACGAPQSEVLGARIRAAGGATGTGLCIGASLLFVTGQVARAPVLVQKLSLEWLHRLAMEPRRMSRRLLTGQLPLLGVALRYARQRGHSPMAPDERARALAAAQNSR